MQHACAVAITKTYFMLMVGDMERATRFYHDALGLEVRSASSAWTELVAADATIALHHGRDGTPADSGLGFEVDNIDAACRAVSDAGGAILRPPEVRREEGITLAMVEDTEGNRFSLNEPTA